LLNDSGLSHRAWAPTDRNINPAAFENPGLGAAVVEIELDPVSLEPLIRGIWLHVDGGLILNKKKARRALVNGAIHALGWACREQLCYVDGKIPLDYFQDYSILTLEEIPVIHVEFLENNIESHKGIGELPFSCIPAAYAQAVSQAMDHHFEKIPLDSREIWSAWRHKQSKAETKEA
jgi:CO/xanthine dehydrogenase Mo-binding subunit